MDTHVERSVVGVPKALLEDERLSFDALALAVYCLGLEENSPVGYRALSGRGLSEARTRKALAELEAAGYRHRGADGRVVISDTPMTTPPTQATAAAPADTASTTGTGQGMVRERRERREVPA
ncbi:hypothetical protein, partial [Actinotignum timonense]